jgi:drug/metabolite transporter (DMT)-like permease
MSTSLSIKGLLNLVVVYLAWGSTYLFIRVAVREGSGFPPFAMAASRTFCAALFLFLLVRFLGYKLRPNRGELKVLVLSAVLMWFAANGMVTWAERHAHSGYAALILGTTPIWPVILESIIRRQPPSPFLVLSLLVGFAGLAVLVAPVLKYGASTDISSTMAILVAAVAWPSGSVLLQRRPPRLNPLVISAYQQFFGSLALAAAFLVTGEPWPQPTTSAWIGWIYLVIVGSLISYTSYVIAVQTLPISVVMTYAYVNPVIAVVLGWLALDELISLETLVGMALILASVAGVFRYRFRRDPQKNRDPESTSSQ